jgi:exopolysaccharide production protein ExoQ
MPPQLALLATTVFVVFLFRREPLDGRTVTGALWIPLLWVLILGSRYASEWLSFGGASDLSEGSPLDATVFLSLQLAGLVVLWRRQVSLSTVVSANLALALFVGFGALSIAWSDFPFVALKRWFKVLGHPIMALIILTEPDPRRAFDFLMKRATYVLIPYSILLIKYYPGMGRGFSNWTGEGFNTGVTTNKNLLGCDLFLLGLFAVCYYLAVLRREKGPERRKELLLWAALLYMIGWLFSSVNSATALMTFIVGVAIVLFVGISFISRKHVGAYLVAALFLLAGADFAFGLSDLLISGLGRDSTLTGRTEIWEDVLAFRTNPYLGTGFESFWLGVRNELMWEKHWWRPNQAHNGYLETYLHLGLIGVVLLGASLVSAFRRASRMLLTDLHMGRFQIGYLAGLVLYNYTEATFKALHLLYFAFYMVAINYPTEPRVEPQSARTAGPSRRTTIRSTRPT